MGVGRLVGSFNPTPRRRWSSLHKDQTMPNAIASSHGVFHDDDAMQKQHEANERALAVRGSFPTKLGAILLGAAVPAHDLCTKKTKAACDEHAALVATLKSQAMAGVEQVRQAVAAANESGTFGDVFMAAEQCKIDRGALSQQAVSVWAKSCEVAEAVVADLAPLPARLEAKAEETIALVKQQLTEIGSGPENMPAYGKNGSAAERQSDYAVRFQNGPARAAIQAVKDAREQLAAATARLHTSREKLVAAKQFLAAEATRAINS
jgi:hypothetical protein